LSSPFQVLYEDSELLAINKPNDLIVHQSKFGGKIDEKSLCQIINQDRDEHVFLVHRLDRKTSGVLLFAKNKEIIPLLQKQFQENRIEKTYRAIVRGHIKENGEINSPIKPEDKKEYKDALTLYTPLSQITVDIPVEPYPQSRYTLLELKPKTGRTHQLRKHCNKIAHPIIGDPKYGNRHHNHMFMEKFNTNKLFLHAYSLQFLHPISGKKIFIQAPLPLFWEETFEYQKWKID
jgi:tRNA pseudouridine65 synthase